MPETLRSRQPLFTALLAVYWAALAALLIRLGYHNSFVVLNSLHQPWLDYPMFVLTHLGDALILTSIIALFLARRRPDLVLLVIAAVLITGLFGQILKNTVFDEWDRPLRALKGIADVHTVAGYKMYHNSFPSGHSIVAAAAITILMVSLKPGWLVQALLALAVMVISYTRIYVGVHFAGDVLAGTFIGFSGALLVHYLLAGRLKGWTDKLSEIRSRRLRRFLFGLAAVSIVAGVWLVTELM